MSLWIAYGLSVISVALVYYGLFQFARLLYRKKPIWAVSLALLLAPFAFVLVHVDSPLSLMWVLLLTPFYGLAVLMMLFTKWMTLYYSLAFCVLALLYFLFPRKPMSLNLIQQTIDYAPFWHKRNLWVKASLRSDEEHRLIGLAKKHKTHILAVIAAVVLVAASLVATGAVRISEVNHVVRDPTYDEVLQFMAADKTEQNRYADKGSFCAQFAEDFKSSAIKSGYRSGYVLVYFPEGRTHALNCFNTTDRGLVFVEPQSDEVVALSIGQPYWNRAKYQQPDYNDTILGYSITW